MVKCIKRHEVVLYSMMPVTVKLLNCCIVLSLLWLYYIMKLCFNCYLNVIILWKQKQDMNATLCIKCCVHVLHFIYRYLGKILYSFFKTFNIFLFFIIQLSKRFRPVHPAQCKDTVWLSGRMNGCRCSLAWRAARPASMQNIQRFFSKSGS